MAVAVGPVLLDILLILVVAKLAGELFERMRQSAVLGELLAGIVLGPSLLGFIDLSVHTPETEVILFVAALGVLLLLFEVGLESNIRELASVGASALNVALIGIVVSFALGAGCSWLFAQTGWWPDRGLLHVFVGATFTATSVGITARVLSDMDKLSLPEARIILGAAVLDDVGGLLILAVVASLATAALSGGEALGWMDVGQTFGLAILFLVVSVFVGIKLMPRVTPYLTRFRVRGVLLSVSVAFCLLLAFLAELAHLAGIVGAFAAGLILAQTKEHHTIFERVRPLGDVFVPFFFVSIGLQVNAREVLSGDVWLLGLVVLVFTAVAIGGKLACGWGVMEKGLSRLAVGVGMVPRGEVGLIFALVGLDKQVIGQWEYGAILLTVMITTFIAPMWLKRAFSKRFTRKSLADTPAFVGQHLRRSG